MTKLAIFASGSGSNALKIIEYFQNKDYVEVACIVTNNPEAGVIKKANDHQIPVEIINRKMSMDKDAMFTMLDMYRIEYIVLAGYLWLIPEFLIHRYPNKILNIHPALLPKYGGKGMYGSNVHRAVKENKENISGMTIHYVTENFDEGAPIFQASVKIENDDSAEEIGGKVLELEHEYYPKVIDYIIRKFE